MNAYVKKIKSYIIGISIPIATGLLAAFLIKDNINIYQNIVKPNLSPPAITFPIVWIILYTFMGISSTKVYNNNANRNNINHALFIYCLQLTANFFWSILFFNKKAFLISFIWLIILLFLILYMITSFFKINKTSALLQIPYVIWVTFAGYLNLMIYLLN